MNKRDKAIALRLIQLGVILTLLLVSVAKLAEASGETAMLGISSRLFYGTIGAVLVIYVALSFSKFMFKNLPSAFEKTEDNEDVADFSTKAAGRMSEIKYGERKKKDTTKFDKYYSVGEK